MAVGRRAFLKTGVGVALGALSTGVAAGCASSSPRRDADQAGNSKVELPVYQPVDAIKPDLPGGGPVRDAFLAYPANPIKLYDAKPGNGGELSATVLLDAAAPAPLDNNGFWKALNNRLGTQLKVSYAPRADYYNKLTVAIAGGQLPEVTYFNLDVPTVSQALTSQFTELGPYLAGDRIKKYPSLAAIPTSAWRDSVRSGGLYGVPWTSAPISSVPQIRDDIVESLGLSPELTNGDDFLKLCRGLTDDRHNRWAMGALDRALVATEMMCGAPNGWQVQDGKFSYVYVTEGYRQAVSIVAQMWKEKLIHPDAPGQGAQSFRTWFGNGTTPMLVDQMSGIPANQQLFSADDPKVQIGGLVLPRWDGGGQAPVRLNAGANSVTGLRKGLSSEQIDRALAILDWLAAPFGSAEALFTRYGLVGSDYNLSGSDPILTVKGQQEVTAMSLVYIANGNQYLYVPGMPDMTKKLHAYEQKLSEATLPYLTSGLISNAMNTKGPTAKTKYSAVELDVMLGRKPLSALDSAVTTWRAEVGDEATAEMEKLYADREEGR